MQHRGCPAHTGSEQLHQDLESRVPLDASRCQSSRGSPPRAVFAVAGFSPTETLMPWCCTALVVLTTTTPNARNQSQMCCCLKLITRTKRTSKAWSGGRRHDLMTATVRLSIASRYSIFGAAASLDANKWDGEEEPSEEGGGRSWAGRGAKSWTSCAAAVAAAAAAKGEVLTSKTVPAKAVTIFTAHRQQVSPDTARRANYRAYCTLEAANAGETPEALTAPCGRATAEASTGTTSPESARETSAMSCSIIVGS